MKDLIEISPLVPGEMRALANLVNSAYRGESSRKGWTTEADLLDGIRIDEHALAEMTSKPGETILVAKDNNGQLIGCVYLQKRWNELYLGMLTVAPSLQAKGIGHQLLQAAESHAAALRCTAVVMTVIDVRHELIQWYQRKGYQNTGEIQPFPTDPSFGIPRQPLQFTVLKKALLT